jgi:hypothetical protein
LTGKWSTVTTEVTDWTLNISPEKNESTTFADTGIFRKWYHGEPEVTVEINGFWPNAVAYPLADIVEGVATDVLVLRTEDATTDFTITITGMTRNIKGPVVNRHTGLNSFSAQFIGRITATAGSLT